MSWIWDHKHRITFTGPDERGHYEATCTCNTWGTTVVDKSIGVTLWNREHKGDQ